MTVSGKFTLDNIPWRAAGMVEFDITFIVTADGTLDVSAKQVGGQAENSIRIRNEKRNYCVYMWWKHTHLLIRIVPPPPPPRNINTIKCHILYGACCDVITTQQRHT